MRVTQGVFEKQWLLNTKEHNKWLKRHINKQKLQESGFVWARRSQKNTRTHVERRVVVQLVRADGWRRRMTVEWHSVPTVGVTRILTTCGDTTAHELAAARQNKTDGTEKVNGGMGFLWFQETTDVQTQRKCKYCPDMDTLQESAHILQMTPTACKFRKKVLY